MSLEDIFIAVVNKTDESKLRREKSKRQKGSSKSAEINAADDIIRKTESDKASYVSNLDDDEE